MGPRRMGSSEADRRRCFQSDDEFQQHELLLRDLPCITAYYDAIMNNRRLFENKIVLDVGSGTGILSMFAAQAGAKRVYAVEACSTICHLAEKLIICNGLQDRIKVINKRVEDIDRFDERIDLIISEWMGSHLFHESSLESVMYARDHFLPVPNDNDDRTPDPAESIVIFPSHAYLYCAPFVDQHIRFESSTMWKGYFDLNLSSVLPRLKNSDLTKHVIDTVEPSQLVHDAQLIHSIDLRTVKKVDLRTMRSLCEFHLDHTGIISGFCFWFDCYFSSTNNSSILSSTRLTTSPYAMPTHWKQTLVFLPEDIYPLKGDIVPVMIKLKQSSNNRRQYHFSISIKKIKERSLDDTPVNDEALHSDSRSRRRRRRRRRCSSTVSLSKRVYSDDPSAVTLSESSESSSSNDDVGKTEHSIPCSCDRDRCQLIKTIIKNHNDEIIVE